MVRGNHLDSPQSSNDVTCQTEAAHNKHTRTASSSGSSTGSYSTRSLDWGSGSFSSSSSLIGQSLCSDQWPDRRPLPSDLIHGYSANGTPTTSSSDNDEDEHIKLLCGDDLDEQWTDESGKLSTRPPLTLSHKGASAGGVYGRGGNRRRRLIPRLLQKVRRKFNWQLLVTLAVILVVGLSVSQYKQYQYPSAGIAGWSINTTRDTAVYLRPDLHTALIEPRIVERSQRYLLLVVVCSAVENFQTRQTIRQTWANVSEFNYAKHFHRMHSHAAHNTYSSTDAAEMQRVRRQLYEPAKKHGGAEATTEDLTGQLSSQVIFLVGRTLSNSTQQLVQEESSSYGDMLQEDFMDTYNNLTLKSLMLLKWIGRFNDDADRVKYVMKCDDDTFLNVPNLMQVLLGGTVPIYTDTLKLYTPQTLAKESWADSASLMGHLFHNARPIRDVTSKWYAPRFMYRQRVFPNYLSGTGYVMEATHTAKELFQAALRTPIFHLEDVYVTGLCARHSESTRPHHNPLFSFQRYAKRPCALRGMITQHPMTAQDIQRAYESITDEAVVCEQPEEEDVLRLLNSKSNAQRAGDCGGSLFPLLTLAVLASGHL